MSHSIYREAGLNNAYMPVDYNPDTTRIAEYADDVKTLNQALAEYNAFVSASEEESEMDFETWCRWERINPALPWSI